MRLRWRFAVGHPEGISQARHDLREAMRAFDASIDPLACEVVLGELVTNAFKYGVEPISATVEIEDDAVTVRTDDSGRGFAMDLERRVAESECGGRGLQICAALAQCLRVEQLPEGCRVSAVVSFLGVERSLREPSCV